MLFMPSIQSLVGAHSGGSGIAIDWANNHVYESSATNLSRYGLLTGLEEFFEDLTTIGGVGAQANTYIGFGSNGTLAVQGPSILTSGSSLIIRATDFSLVTGGNILYPNPNFGGGGYAGISIAGIQFFQDKGLGSSIIPTLNRNQFISRDLGGWLAEDDMTGIGAAMCSDQPGTGNIYQISPDVSGIGPLYFDLFAYGAGGFVGKTHIGSVTIGSIDAAWTANFTCNGMCLDQSDRNILAIITGTGGANVGYIVKLNRLTGAIIWKSIVPPSDGGSAVFGGNVFSNSLIQHNRVAFYTGSPTTVSIYDTTNGSLVTQYHTHLDGYTLGASGQCYNDTISGIVIEASFAQGPGSPTLLNSTPASWANGYSVLYVADAVVSSNPSGSGNPRIIIPGGNPNSIPNTPPMGMTPVGNNPNSPWANLLPQAPLNAQEADRWC